MTMNLFFIKGSGRLTPLTYDAIRTFYKEKIDPAFIALFPHYRTKSNKIINNMVNIIPHVGRHTWANITLEFMQIDTLQPPLSWLIFVRQLWVATLCLRT